MEVNENYLFFFVFLLFIALLILNCIEKSQNEGYAYTYPYSFIQCAQRTCPFEYRMAPYLTDEDAFVKVY